MISDALLSWTCVVTIGTLALCVGLPTLMVHLLVPRGEEGEE